MNRLTREFYMRASLEVAPDLLGKYLIHVVDGKELVGKIVEVEAYMGPHDKAAHSYNNRRTERNEVMYGPGGYAYVYIIYGMYYCMNVITAKKDVPHGVLIRAVEPVKGIEEMARNRFKKDYNDLTKSQIKNLTNGPGKLCSAMGITRDNNGDDLLGDRLYIMEPEFNENFTIARSPRINIDYAEEARDYLWRFYIKGNMYVSKPHE